MNYEYVKDSNTTNQYIDIDLEQTNTVEARYVESNVEYDKGNPFIEALPKPRTAIKYDYSKSIPGYSREKQAELSNYDKLSSIYLLREVRFPLPFHAELEEAFGMSLLMSYRKRRLDKSLFSNYTICVNNQEEKTNSRLIGENTDSANAGINVLGYSGCGKSAAVKILLSNYPQVIKHNLEDGNKFTQIVYISVVCAPNSNFSALYQNIAAEIDRALGNMEPFYEKYVERTRGLAQKADIICRLIDTFGIGCIILDEIQLINFKGQSENTFEGLLTIVNKTKVALMTVGTEDAYNKMFPNLRTARRTGSLINAKGYCDNKKFFANIVLGLMRYQWFDQPVKATKEMVEAFYNVTKGIIDQLVGVYMFMQIDYLRASKKPDVNADYIYKIADKYYPGMQKLLDNVNTVFSESEIKKINENAEEKLLKIIDAARQEQETEKLMKDFNIDAQTELQNMKDNALNRVQDAMALFGKSFTTREISRAIDKAVSQLGPKKITETTISQAAVTILNTNSSSTTKKTPAKRAKKDKKNDFILASLEENQ